MSDGLVRVTVGTRFLHDGDLMQVVETQAAATGTVVVLGPVAGASGPVVRASLRDLLDGSRARLLPDGDGPSAEDGGDPASVVLAGMSVSERNEINERAAHVREALTGFRSGLVELPAPGEPQERYDPRKSLTSRYTAKAVELGVSVRTIKQWVADFRRDGVAGLARKQSGRHKPLGNVDERWTETALEVMVEHTDQSRPSQSIVISRTNARVVVRFGEGAVSIPSRATAYRILAELENRHPTFRLATKRNRDIAGRPAEAYGKLRPTRPGEYLLMDTTRLDVFAMDPLTLRWVQAELTVGMDWYTRCITGIRVTPVSTKSVDAAAVLYQAYRPRPAGTDWPAHAVWPEHGVPRSVLLDTEAFEGPICSAAGPAIVPETIVVDHGKIYVSEHLTSVCQRMGISIQPARLRTGRDKGPVERFFRTMRQSLLQVLPGYKGPDVHSRGLDPESEAFFYLDELESIIREWVASFYHHHPHDSLRDPHVPGLLMSPAQMFEQGMARAGYIEAPRDPDLAYEFLNVKWRTIQHYGVELGQRYNGSALDSYRNVTSAYTGRAKGRWPIHYTPDDITRAYFRDPETREWHTLTWEHAPAMKMPLSQDAMTFARKLAAAKYTYPDDRLAITDLFERWNLGLGDTLAERRMALRLSRDAVLLDELPTDGDVAALPSVRRALAAVDQPDVTARKSVEESGPECGDDDVAHLHAGDVDQDDFYANALEDA